MLKGIFVNVSESLEIPFLVAGGSRMSAPLMNIEIMSDL